MPAYAFVTVDVFTERRFGGNPLAVFTDARGLSDTDMQALAAEFNLSETTFVLPPDDPAHTARVRIFTPAHELAFAGHPNVGTGYVLARQGPGQAPVMLFEEAAGLVEVRIEHGDDGSVEGANITAPQPLSLGMTFPAGLTAACIGLTPADIVLAAHAPVLASVGNPFVLVEVAADALSRAAPDLGGFRQMAATVPELEGRLDIYLYARDAQGGLYARDAQGESQIRARMFGPLMGIWEDPATGSAATTLAALLLSLTEDASHAFDILQGVEMRRPSLLRAAAYRAADGIRSSVGGRCVPMLRGEALL